MCLLLTLMAAVAATVAWYACEKRKTYRLGTLCLIYWGSRADVAGGLLL